MESQTAKFSVLLLCSGILASESQDQLAGVAPMPTFEPSSSGEHQLLHVRASNCSLKIAFVEPRLPPSILCITLILLPLLLKHWDYRHSSPCCFLFKFVLLFVRVAVEQIHSFLHVMQALCQLRHSTSSKHVRNWDFTWLHICLGKKKTRINSSYVLTLSPEKVTDMLLVASLFLSYQSALKQWHADLFLIMKALPIVYACS